MDDHRNSGDEERPDEQTAHREHGGDDATHDRGSIGPGSEEPEPRVEQTLLEEEADAAEAEERGAHPEEAHGHGRSGQGHRGMHAGHEEMFRRRFLVSTLLSIPVLLYSETLQEWLGFTVPTFPGSEWINPVFATVVFAYGGVPFLRMALPEVRNRSPGMMTLISMAITVAFVYSLVGVVYPTTSAFFWELVTLVDIMLLGHWIEMRSVRQASSALDELAQLIPDTAERTTDTGDIEEVPVSELEEDDLVLVRPGANVPADGVVAIGSGTDVAVQSADLILVQNNPLAVVRLVRLSKASYRKMQENLVWAAGYNVVAIPLAAGVLAPVGILLSPAVGALLMSLSTVIVAINAQFLRRVDLDLPSLPDAAPSGSPRPADQADTSPRLRTGRQFMTEYGLLEGTERFRCPVKIDAIRFC